MPIRKLNWHIECLLVLHLGSGVHGIYPIYVNIRTFRRRMDAITIVNQDTTRFHLALELIHGRLVQDNSDIIFIQYG